MNTELTRLTDVVKAQPNLRFDPNYISMYSKAGGTLSNGAIPTMSSEPVQVQKTAVQPTTLSSEKVTSEYIPEIKQKIQQYSQPTTTTNPETGAVVKTSTGEPFDVQTVREANGTYMGQDGNKYYNWDSTPVVSKTLTPEDPLDARTREMLSKLQTQSDEITSAMIANIKANYENLKNQQRDINMRYEKGVNTAAIMGGTARYAAGTAEGMTASAMSYGVQKLAELEQKEQEAVLKAKQAQYDNNWNIASKEMDIIEKIRQEKAQAAKELNNKLIEANQKIREKEVQASRDQAIGDLMSQGITDPSQMLEILGGDFTAKEISDAMKNLAKDSGSGSLENLSGDVKTFYALKEMGNLPTDILSLPQDQQMFAFIKRLNQAQSVKTAGSTSPTEAAFEAGNVPFQATIENAAGFETSDKANARTAKELANLATIGDYNNLLVRVQNQAKKGMSSADKTEVTKAEKQVKAADRMTKAIEDFQAAGGDMGYFKGKADKIATRLGQLATDPKFKALATELTAAFQQYRQDMTGAAFGAAESADYATVVPTADKNIDLNLAVLQGLRNYMQGKVDDAYSTTLGEGYENINGLAKQSKVNDPLKVNVGLSDVSNNPLGI